MNSSIKAEVLRQVEEDNQRQLDEWADEYEKQLITIFGRANETEDKARIKYSPSDTPKQGDTPAPDYGVAPHAELADRDDEWQQLNLAGSANPFSDANGRAAYKWITGEDDKQDHDYDTPHLSRPTSPQYPAILKSLGEVLEKSLDLLSLNLSDELSARAVLAELQGGQINLSWTPSIKNPGLGDYIIWTNDDTFSVPAGNVRLTSLLSSLRKSSRDEGLNQELGTLVSKAVVSAPISLKDAVAQTDMILKAARTLGVSIPETLDKSWTDDSNGNHVSKLMSARREMLKAAEQMEGTAHPSVLSAMTSLADDTLNLIEGIKLGNLTGLNSEPEHDIIKESGADAIYNDVETSDALLEKVGKAVLEVEYDKVSAKDDEDDDLPHEGMMVAWYPTNGFANQLVKDDEERAKRLHLTLVYFGKSKDFTDEQKETIKEVLTTQVALQKPLNGTISGLALFNTDDDGLIPIVALVDADGLVEFQKVLVAALKEKGIPYDDKHSFTPHITLDYGDVTGLNLLNYDIPHRETTPLSIDKIWLVDQDEKVEEYSLDTGISEPSGYEEPTIKDRIKASDDDAISSATLFNKMWRRQIVDDRYSLAVVKNEGGKRTVLDVD